MTVLGRRSVVGGLIGAIPLLAATAMAQECAVFNRERQAALSPDAALELLRAGNARFLEGRSINCDLIQQVHETAQQQAPIAAIVGCIDSRVPPELVFDQRIGDIFTARVAGNFANVDILGSLEFATEVAGAKAIVVLGHSSCGAIKAAIEGVQAGNMTAMLANLQPAVDTVGSSSGPISQDNAALVQQVAEQNVLLTAASLAQRSDILRQRMEAGTLKVAAAMHDITTGRVSWL
jgi:carbonic anhydrase